MAFNYSQILDVAVLEISDKGQDISINRVTPGTFTPSTGLTTGGSTTTATIKAVVTDVRENQINDSTIQRGDKILLIAADTTAPELEDSVTIDSLDYQIVNINTISPGGTAILHKVQVRR